jgi:CheY-like chemotaxis protein
MTEKAAIPRRVLVADDDPVTRKLLQRALTASGYQIILASDGLRALATLDDNPDIDLLITDVLMPNMDGRDLVRALREDDRFEHLPLIIMSATVSIGEIRRLLELGASRFLAKPVSPALLRREVAALFV